VKLVVTAFVTLDGVVEAPGFDEHKTGRNAWALRVQGDEDYAYNMEQIKAADAFLLGRRTWQIWAAFWPTAEGDPEIAERVNGMRKYVVSNTLERADWSNSTILAGDIAAEVRKLKARPGRELVVYGSPDLVDELLRHDLVDEYRLLLYPVILGAGKHLFRDRIDTHHLRLEGTRTFSSGVVLLTYVPEHGEPAGGRFYDSFHWTPDQVENLRAAEDSDRTLATVLFADVVDSTGRAAAMGDRAWRKLLEEHQRVVHAEVARWNGRNVEFAGDGVMAIFDAPTRALRCAFGLVEAARGIGIETRVGLHTGEVERRETGIAGIAVHIAARLLGSASSGQVVVTRTVRDLATGTGLAFRHLGAVELRGVPGEWDLFEASPA
jgi:class 3 adenylate cyclase/dihydrofolate reductase